MPLPDLTRMAALPDALWRVLRARLQAIGLTYLAVQPVTRVCAQLPDPLRRPLRRWHLRRMAGPLARAMRLLVFADPVAPAEARAALGPELVDPLLAAGFIAALPDGTLVSPFLLNVVNELYVICDDLRHGGDAVMGAGGTTALLCQAAHPTHRLGRALDLGCGAGTAALLFAERVDGVVASDINARAVTLTRINAAMNGISNVDVRLGDLFAPVAGERFDLIVSQPPYVPRPPDAGGATYLYGGPRGDELPWRILHEIADYLAPGGRAVLQIEWPRGGAESIAGAVRAAFGTADVNLLVIEAPGADLDEHATLYAFGETLEIDPGFGERAIATRDHFARLGINSLVRTCLVIERTDRSPLWTETLTLGAQGLTALTAGQIDRLLLACTLRSGPDEQLRRARLVIPPGTVFLQERALEPAPSGPIRATFPPRTLRTPVTLNERAFQLALLIDELPDVDAAIERFAEDARTTVDTAAAKLLPAVREALATGVLEPAPVGE